MNTTNNIVMPTLWTVEETAKKLGLPKTRIYEFIRIEEGKFPARKVGKSYRIHAQKCAIWVDNYFANAA